MATLGQAEETWFGEKELAEGSSMFLRLGPLSVWLAHLGDEWRIASTNSGNLRDSSGSLTAVALDSEPPDAETLRFPGRDLGDRIRIQPRLADRPVVARPEHPLLIPSGASADVYVSSPLWVGFELSLSKRVLVEIPTTRPSDTWIGTDTRSGQLAYASRTSARLTPQNLPFRPHRVVTHVSIRNRSQEVLPVERLSIPAPSLALYVDHGGIFWTPSITAVRETSSEDKAPSIDRPPELAGSRLRRIAEPRSVGTPNVLQRALQSLRG